MSAKDGSDILRPRRRGRPGLFPVVREKVLRTILSDASGQAGALTCGIGHSMFCRFAVLLGFRRMYVTDAERALIMRMRAEAKEAAA